MSCRHSKTVYFQTNPLVLFQFGERAATLNVAELYVSAFSNLAKTNNTVLLPANVGDAGSMVAQVSSVQAAYWLHGRAERKIFDSRLWSTDREPNDYPHGLTDEVNKWEGGMIDL